MVYRGSRRGRSCHVDGHQRILGRNTSQPGLGRDTALTLRPFTLHQSATTIVYGAGCVATLPDIASKRGARRVAVVLDDFFTDGDLEARLRGLFSSTETDVVVHGVPNREPDTDSVEACHAVFVASDPDMIIAVGGGSTMDTAKVARILLSNPGGAAEVAGFDRHFHPHASLLVCIPTTAGTASEVSDMAVIARPGLDIKLRYRSANITAGFALLDPELLLTLPAAVTASAGFDAATHALESYVSRSASVVTDVLALDALNRLVEWLPVAYAEPDNLTARGHCLVASMLGGFVCNSTQLGLAHAIAAPLGAMHHVVHGVANAIALPAVTAFNERELGDKAGPLAECFGSATPAEGVAAFRAHLNLDIGIDEMVGSDEEREAIALATMKSGNIPTNPRTPELHHVRAILDAMRQPIGKNRPSLFL